MQYNLKERIREHYDFASPYYMKLWGKHLHHGYYESGNESKEEAAENLIKLLVVRSGLHRGARVLDVGCGMGGTAVWLAENMGCKVIGVTISPVQVRMALEAVEGLEDKPEFILDDANDLSIKGVFDIVWAVEVVAHLSNRSNFFSKAAKLLAPGGKICEAAWLKADGLSDADEQKHVRPIEEGMLVSLPTLSEYERHMEDNGLRLLTYEDISPQVAPTWDICLNIIKDKTVWEIAARHSSHLISFLKSFKAMRNGFKTGAFRYALMVSERSN